MSSEPADALAAPEAPALAEAEALAALPGELAPDEPAESDAPPALVLEALALALESADELRFDELEFAEPEGCVPPEQLASPKTRTAQAIPANRCFAPKAPTARFMPPPRFLPHASPDDSPA